MKKILALLLFGVSLFTLSGCDIQTQTSQSQAEVQVWEKSNTGHFVLSQPALEELEKKSSEITAEDVYFRDTLKTLEYYGVDISIENSSKIDNDSVYYELVLSNKDNTVAIPVIGLLNYIYYPEGFEYYGKTEYISLYGVCGSTIDVTDRYITVVNSRQATVLDVYSLEKQPVEFDLSILGENRIVPTCTRASDRYAFAYYTDSEKGIAFFTLDGKYINRFVVDSRIKDGEYIIALEDDRDKNNLNLYPNMNSGMIFLDKEETLIHCGNGFCLNIETGKITSDSLMVDCLWYDGVIMMYKVYRSQPADGQREYYIMAVSHKDGKTQKIFSDVDLNPGFAFDGDNDENYQVYSDRHEEVTVECNNTGQRITFNFNNGTAQSSYSVSNRMLKNPELIADSSDGKLSLYSVVSAGGGDISYRNVLLRNNLTGRVKYIDYIGGMYGGGCSAGFFSNGDIYVLRRDDFKVFSTDMNDNGPIFCLSQRNSFGECVDGGTKARWLLAARRDPKNYSYIAVYGEADITADSIYIDEWRLNDTYKVGFFDAYGKKVKEYDTNVNVLVSAFGLVPVNMWLSGENLHMYGYVKSTENKYFEGYININTGKYTPVINFDR